MEAIAQRRIASDFEAIAGTKRPELPSEVVVGAMRYGEKVRGTCHVVTHEEVEGIIYKLRGWS